MLKRHFLRDLRVMRRIGVFLWMFGLSLPVMAGELNVWVMSVTARTQQDMKEVLRPYLQANPNLRVNVTALTWENAWEKINAAAKSGQGPDIVELGSTWVAAISAKGALEAISPRQQQSVGGAQAFFPALWVSTKNAKDGQVFAIPWYADARVAYYRTDVFQKAGIQANEAFANWGSFKQAMQKINGIKLNGKTMAALGYPGKTDLDILHNLAPWIWNAGGDFLTSDLTSSRFNSPEALQAVSYFTSFSDEGLVPLSALEKDSTQIESAFFNGQYAVIFSGPWLLKILSTDKAKGGQKGTLTADNFSVASYPAGIKGNQTFFSGSDLAVMKSSKNKDEAWDLLRFLVSREAQVGFSLRSGMLPARLDALNDPSLLQIPHYSDFIAQVKLGRHYPVVSAWGQLETIFAAHIAKVVGETTGDKAKHSTFEIKKILDRASSEANKALKETH